MTLSSRMRLVFGQNDASVYRAVTSRSFRWRRLAEPVCSTQDSGQSPCNAEERRPCAKERNRSRSSLRQGPQR